MTNKEICNDVPLWISYPTETYIAITLFLLLIIFCVLIFILYLKSRSLKEIEKNILLKSKQAAMGEMIIAITHQWRQPLNEINSITSAIDYELITSDKKNQKIEEYLVAIEMQTQYMSSTIDNFKNFFKPSKSKTSFNTLDVINYALELLNAKLNATNIYVNISNINNYGIVGFKGEFTQVIITLLSNAMEALIQRDIKNPTIKIVIDKNISIEDNAKGIDEKIIDKIFDPYFTTKQQYNGTGMGLYISKMIIEDSMNGTLKVSNTKDGAKFIIEGLKNA